MALAYKHRRRGGSLRMALLLALSAVFLLVLRPVIFQVAQAPGDQPVGLKAAGSAQVACQQCACPDAVAAAGGGQQLAAASSTAAAVTSGDAAQRQTSPYELPPVDLARLFNAQQLLSGIVYGQDTCFPPFDLAFKEEPALADALQAKLYAALHAALEPLATEAARAAGDIDDVKLLELAGVRTLDDPAFDALDHALTSVVANYLVFADGSRVCVCGKRIASSGRGPRVASTSDVGTSGCKEGEAEPEHAGVACMGSLGHLLLGPKWSLAELASAVRKMGVCTNQPREEKFGTWWMKERLYNPAFQNFQTLRGDKQDDTILELFDVLYERDSVFQRQRWLGFTCMQDPFDLLAIQNLIFELKPDLLIETGTANGGSALLWSSILEISDLHDSRIHTVDVKDPAIGFGSDGSGATDPTKHRLWQKYVTFHQGQSTSAPVVEAITAVAAKARRVLVLLDSDHGAQNVAREIEIYCKNFVTVGSYCIVEDTKLSRMQRAAGPLAPVLEFLRDHREPNATSGGQQWVADRKRELMYSQHVMGYMKRTA